MKIWVWTIEDEETGETVAVGANATEQGARISILAEMVSMCDDVQSDGEAMLARGEYTIIEQDLGA